MAQSTAARFWSKVDRSGECWTWTAACDRKGYGRMRFPRRHEGAHRVSWELTNGPIPEGMFVCHRCDNPPCVRPDHLFLGSHRDNMADMFAKGRDSHPPTFYGDAHWIKRHGDHRPKGGAHPQAKLTDAEVAEVRRMVAAGSTQASLCRQYGISKTHMSRIVRGLAR